MENDENKWKCDDEKWWMKVKRRQKVKFFFYWAEKECKTDEKFKLKIWVTNKRKM